MRIFPFSAYCIRNAYDDRETLQVIRRAAGLTHGHDISAMSCFLYSVFLRECIRTKKPVEGYKSTFEPEREKLYGTLFSEEAVSAHAHLFSRNFYRNFDPDTVPESGYVVDSPGHRGFGLVDVEKDEIARYFPEMLKASEGCRFTPCTQTHEPGCAVKAALEDGTISRERYNSYLGMLEEDGKFR